MAHAATHRMFQRFRPSTQTTYVRMFRDFLIFLLVAGIHLHQVTTITLLAFMEFLVANQMSQSNIANYIASIRAIRIAYGLNTSPFQDHRLPLVLKSLRINAPLKPKNSSVITIPVLTNIMEACTRLQHPVIFRALYLLWHYFLPL